MYVERYDVRCVWIGVWMSMWINDWKTSDE